MKPKPRQSVTRNTRCFGNKTVASKLLSVLVLVLLGFSCAPATGIDNSIEPTASGPPLNLNLDAVQPSSVILVWQAPRYRGTKTGGTSLQEEELAYQVYYVQGNVGDELPTAKEVKDLATLGSPKRMAGTALGITRIQIENLNEGARYFLAVETFNSFAAASTLSEKVIDIVIPRSFDDGLLSYAQTEYELMVRDSAIDSAITIVPDSVPTITTNEISIRYVFEKIEGDLADMVISVDGGTGEVMINPTATGTAKFVVRAEADGYFSQEVMFTIRVVPRISGAVTGISIDKTSIEDHSFEVQWTEPVETGTRQDGTKLDSEELMYRVYYISGNVGDMFPEAEVLARDARIQSQIEQVQGTTNVRLLDLDPGTRYFVAVETYNPFTEVGTLSGDVVEETSTTGKTNLSGMLSYDQSEYSYSVRSPSVTIDPKSRPTVVGGSSISYGLYKRGGVQFANSTVMINATTGAITVNPSTTMAAGAVNYRVFARMTGFNTQYVELTIRITQIEMDITMYHSQEAETTIPVPFGQAIVDAGRFSLADDEMVLSIESSEFSGSYTVHVDTGMGISGSQGASITKTPNAENRIVIQKSELRNNNLSEANGAVIGLSGSGLVGTQELAIYRPREIHGWQDLQAMRVDMYGDYVLKKDIRFPDTTEGTSNYESIGQYEGILVFNPEVDNTYETVGTFKGSIDGTNGSGSFRIIGMQIESSNSYEGLFGAVDGRRLEKIVAQNLIFVGCTIKGKDQLGTLIGHLSDGTVRNVGVELGPSGAGKVEGIVEYWSGREVGGLVGFNIRARVEGYSEVPVIGNEMVGGLVGNNNTDAVVVGYSTGDVTGEKYVGGLAGANSSDSTTSVMGYSTGDVTGSESIGGLVGLNSGSNEVKGYSTGDITGSNNVGGLVGSNQSGRIGDRIMYADIFVERVGNIRSSEVNVIGYATGTVTGTRYVGGMIGVAYAGVVVGYSRSTVYRNEGIDAYFGRTVGAVFESSWASSEVLEQTRNSIRRRTYHSQGSNPPESQLLNADRTELGGASGEHGNPVNGRMNDTSLFSEFFASDSSKDWVWMGNGRWPALDLGGLISVSDQPTN